MEPTDQELFAYLDEMLSAERAAELERLLRDRSDLRHRAALLSRRRDQGGHSVGDVWRRLRLSCLSRPQLGSYLLGACDPDLEEYVAFHVREIGCRLCQANLEDLRSLQSGDVQQQTRRERYFESSAGVLRSRPGS